MEQNKENVTSLSNEARNNYVLEQMTKSMLKLLKNKPIEEISVSEICDDAGVGRTSFYRNYKAKEDIIKNYIEEMLEDWDSNYKESGKDSNAELYGSFFKHLKDNSDFYLLLKKRELMNLFLAAYMKKYGPAAEDTNIWAYTKSFIAYGTYGWIEEWIARGMVESADTMAEMLASNGMK